MCAVVQTRHQGYRYNRHRRREHAGVRSGATPAGASRGSGANGIGRSGTAAAACRQCNDESRIMNTILLKTLLGVCGALIVVNAGQTQGLHTGPFGVTLAESTQVAMGWSVRKRILGKPVYNEAGDRLGKVNDLFVAPDSGISYLIIGAGDFLGVGRYDVAVPVTQVVDQGGRFVMPGATAEVIRAMPRFEDRNETVRRDPVIAALEPVSPGVASSRSAAHLLAWAESLS
jgi:sporulation protein YlmC with PRC-barrel domain